MSTKWITVCGIVRESKPLMWSKWVWRGILVMYYLKTRKQVNPENLRDPNNVPVLFLYTLESGPLTPKQELEDMERAFYARYPTPQEQESDEAKKEMESILSHKLQVLEHELNFISEEKNIILQKQNDIKIREEKGDFQLEIEKIFLEQQKQFLKDLDKKFSNMLKKCKEQYENDRDMHQSKNKNKNGN